MLSFTVQAVCLNLILCGLAESFVLLTANVEDIRQIAKKFLSNTFADQITELLSKAKLQDALSAENERNAREDRNSRELEETQAFKYHEPQKPEETYGHDLKPKYDYENNDRPEYMNIVKDPKYIEKKRNESRRPSVKRESVYAKSDYGSVYDKSSTPSRFKVKSKGIVRMGDNQNPDMQQTNGYKQRVQVTTERARNEFDQYDHTDHSDLVATSGHVLLPRVRGFNNEKA